MQEITHLLKHIWPDYTAGECKAFKLCLTQTADDISDNPSQKKTADSTAGEVTE